MFALEKTFVPRFSKCLDFSLKVQKKFLLYGIFIFLHGAVPGARECSEYLKILKMFDLSKKSGTFTNLSWKIQNFWTKVFPNEGYKQWMLSNWTLWYTLQMHHMPAQIDSRSCLSILQMPVLQASSPQRQKRQIKSEEDDKLVGKDT